MSLASEKYDVILNGQGLILIEESYRKRAQQPFSPRFATGDPGYGDLSFWQFLKQEAWDGGIGQAIFSTTNKIMESMGWDFRFGEPRLSFGQRTVDTSGSPITALVSTVFNNTGKLLKTAAATSTSKPQLILLGRQSSTPGTGTRVAHNPSDSTDPVIVQFNSECGAIWNRSFDAADTDCNYIAVSGYAAGVAHLLIYRSDGTAIADITLTNIIYRLHIIQPISSEVILCVDQHGMGVLVTFTVSTHTVASQKRFQIAANSSTEDEEIMSHGSCLDGSGNVYILTQHSVGPDGTTGYLRSNSTVHLITAADLLLAGGPRISSSHILDQIIGTAIHSLNGVVYILGSYQPKANSLLPIIIKYPDTLVWKGRRDSKLWDNLIPCTFQSNRDSLYFIMKPSWTNGGAGDYDSIYKLNASDVVQEVCAIDRVDPASDNFEHMALAFVGNRFYWYNVTANAAYSTNETRGSLVAGDQLQFETSEFGGNTPLINKTLYSITVELSEAIPTGQLMSFLVNDTDIATMLPAHGTKKEFILTTEITGGGFIVTVSCVPESTWTGYIKKISLRFLPTQFKKLAWAFGIRADRNLKLIDGSRETSSPATIFANLKTAWESNVPISFTDVDGAVKTVIVTDFDQRRPLLNRDAGKEESFCFLELLEV